MSTRTGSQSDVTRLLQAWSDGDESALHALTPLVYAELRAIARRYMANERTSHTLESGALVNEAYMRLVDWRNVRWQNRAQFFAASAKMMRHILVDHARGRGYQKRGGDVQRIELEDAMVMSESKSATLIALDEALQRLTSIDPRKGSVVEMRFFGGLKAEEIAVVLKVSPNTVLRDWSLARAWLIREMNGENTG